MALPTLGKLVTLSAQSVWGHEAHVFTPWLASNLDLIGEALQFDELELRGTEVSAGDFRLDNLAEDVAGNTAQYNDLHGWMLDKMQRFRAPFAGRVRDLDLAVIDNESDE